MGYHNPVHAGLDPSDGTTETDEGTYGTVVHGLDAALPPDTKAKITSEQAKAIARSAFPLLTPSDGATTSPESVIWVDVVEGSYNNIATSSKAGRYSFAHLAYLVTLPGDHSLSSTVTGML